MYIAVAAVLLCAVAANAVDTNWHVTSNVTVGSWASGIAFWTKDTGMLVAANNVEGYQVFLTTNAGVNWTSVQWSIIADLQDVAVASTVAIVCADDFVEYTLDQGKTFNASAHFNGSAGNIGGCFSGARALV